MTKKILYIFILISTTEILLSKKINNSPVKMLNGEYAKLYDFNNEGPIIVNFWTTW